MRSFLLLAVVWLVPYLHADDAPKNGNITSAEGKCSVTFPATPKLQTEKNQITYVLGENQDKHGYLLHITIFDKPQDLTDEDRIKKLLDACYLQTKASLGTKASKMLKGTFGKEKVPMRYYEFDLSDGVLWTRHVMTSKALIQITISGPSDWAKGERAQTFFKSLKIESSRK